MNDKNLFDRIRESVAISIAPWLRFIVRDRSDYELCRRTILREWQKDVAAKEKGIRRLAKDKKLLVAEVDRLRAELDAVRSPSLAAEIDANQPPPASEDDVSGLENWF